MNTDPQAVLAEDGDDLEAIARKHCAKLFESKAAKALPPDMAAGLIIIAFTYGAAWALERPDMINLGDAQFDALRSAKQ